MSVKTASSFVTRAMRAAIGETISPANQGSRDASATQSLSEVGKVSSQFGQELYQQLNAYTGSVEEFGCPGNTVDSWRLEFSRKTDSFEAANGITRRKMSG